MFLWQMVCWNKEADCAWHSGFKTVEFWQRGGWICAPYSDVCPVRLVLHCLDNDGETKLGCWLGPVKGFD